jgi:hypothetical protein
MVNSNASKAHTHRRIVAVAPFEERGIDEFGGYAP